METLVTGSLQGRSVELQQRSLAYQIPQLMLPKMMLRPLSAITNQVTGMDRSFSSTQSSLAMHLVPIQETASASQVKFYWWAPTFTSLLGCYQLKGVKRRWYPEESNPRSRYDLEKSDQACYNQQNFVVWLILDKVCIELGQLLDKVCLPMLCNKARQFMSEYIFLCSRLENR